MIIVYNWVNQVMIQVGCVNNQACGNLAKMGGFQVDFLYRKVLRILAIEEVSLDYSPNIQVFHNWTDQVMR